MFTTYIFVLQNKYTGRKPKLKNYRYKGILSKEDCKSM